MNSNQLTKVFEESVRSAAAEIAAPMMEEMESRQLMSLTLDTGTLLITDTRPTESLSLNYSKIEYGYKLTLNYKYL